MDSSEVIYSRNTDESQYLVIVKFVEGITSLWCQMNYPGVLLRERRPARVVFFSTAILLIGSFFLPDTPMYVWARRILLVAMMISLYFGLFYIRRRRRRYLQAHQYEVCVECDYPLTGLERCGQCPECGTPYDKMSLHHQWRSFVKPLADNVWDDGQEEIDKH